MVIGRVELNLVEQQRLLSLAEAGDAARGVMNAVGSWFCGGFLFYGIPGGIWKRFGCPVCRCVMRLRPKGYFKRFQASIQRIYACLSQRSQRPV
jgi:hypothetical protein